METLKLSFIVPVYNVAPYLRKCVESLIHQDFSNYEIILVDDGSTDESGALCEEISHANDGMSRDKSLNEPLTLNDGKPIIKVIHQVNGGLSAARNAGLKVAKGEYVCFVDSDDYWEPNVLGGLMQQVEREKLDVLRFDYQNVRELESERNYEVFEPNKTPRFVDRITEVVDGESYLNTRMGYACYAVMFVIKRSLLINELVNESVSELGDGNCLFTEGIHFEDTEWLPRMMLAAKGVNSTTMVVYNYLVRQGSITKVQGDKQKMQKNLEDQMKIIGTYSKHIELYPTCVWLKNMQSSMAAGVLTTVAREFYSERSKYIARLREMKVFPLRIADQGRTYKRRATIINAFGPCIYCWLMSYL